MEQEIPDLEWTEKPFSEAFVDLVALGQLACAEVTRIQKNAILKGMHERCVACLESLCNSLVSHLPLPYYPNDLKSIVIRKLSIVEKISLLSTLRSKLLPADLIKSMNLLICGRNEKISHPKVKTYSYQILSNNGIQVVFDCKKDKLEWLEPHQIIEDLVQIIDQFLIEIHQVPEDQLRSFILDSATLPGGGVGTFVNTDLIESYSILVKEFKLQPKFLQFLKAASEQVHSVVNGSDLGQTH